MIHRKSRALESSVIKGQKIYKPSLYQYVIDRVRLENARREGFGDDIKAWDKAREKSAFEFMRSL